MILIVVIVRISIINLMSDSTSISSASIKGKSIGSIDTNR